MKEVYFLGVVDDKIFEGKDTFQSGEHFKSTIKSDYDGLVLLGIRLKERENGLLPTRSQLAEITRAFNREFKYTPVTIVFQYGSCISLANSERLKYKQKSQEGERAGKVSLLYNIKTEGIHSGHLKILGQLQISPEINSYAGLYQHWQQVLSVSVLNKSFYEELSNWYFWAIKSVRFPGEPAKEDDEKTRVHRAQNIIRLVTRLVFCWFIKEKGLINAKLFHEDSLKNWVELGEKSDSNYYKAILQNLFFATLNQKMNKRAFRRDGQNYNATNLLRYKKLFKDQQKALELFKDTPFLNGGLFECLDKPDENGKVERIDGFSDRDDNVLSIPNELFFTPEHNEDLSEVYGETKHTKVKGLIKLLNSYVFTITENTPVEEEVALDPELPGKVFENLLASYNPETKTTARKQTGSFYTPREIVNYMVDESLMEYLKGLMEVGEKQRAEWDKKLRQLFSYDDHEPFSDQATAKKIIEALNNCTILDPACGSGAFPMGVLQKMVHLLQKLDPGNKQWKDRQLQRARQIEAPDTKEKAIEDIEEAFENNELDYGRKLYLIENCIYGIDIQPIATQISKLRFFISLVADQKINPEKENLGIRPLPNLETKFVAANALAGLERPKRGQTIEIRNPEIEKKEKELSEVRHSHFSAKTPTTKRKYRESDKVLREEIAELLKNDGWNDQVANQVASWNPYDQNASSSWFDPEWMFGVKEFDLVIGNPPYVQIQKLARTQTQKDLENQRYQTFKKTGDIYALFYERGLNLCKPACHAKGVGSGLLCYITSNKWMRAGYGEPLRAFFAGKNPRQLLDFGGFKVFESATVDTNILLIENKNSTEKSLQACHFQNDYHKGAELTDYFQKNKIALKQLSADTWFIGSKSEIELKQKIEKTGTPLKDWDVKINRGILTGFNEAFIIGQAKRDELVAADPKCGEIIKPILRGRDIKRYRHEWAGLWVIGTFPALDIDIEDYPAVKNYLESFGKKLHQTGENFTNEEGKTEKSRKKTGNKWFETQDQISYYQDFEKEKVVYPNMTKFLPFIFDKSGYYANQKCFILTGKKMRFLTGYLNSKFSQKWIKENCPELQGGTRELSKIYFENIPIPQITPTNQALATQIETLVDKILALKKESPKADTGDLEAQIDELVFDLYGLTEGERKIVLQA